MGLMSYRGKNCMITMFFTLVIAFPCLSSMSYHMYQLRFLVKSSAACGHTLFIDLVINWKSNFLYSVQVFLLSDLVLEIGKDTSCD
jgi:hypothetical protein